MEFDFLDNSIIKIDMNEIYVKSYGDLTFLKDKKIFISGATGMLASYFIYFLIYLNEKYTYNIKIFAGIRDDKKAENIFGKYLSKEYLFLVKGDISSQFGLTEKVDYIIHAASLASPQYYGKMPVETILPNVVGTYNLLEYSKTNNIKSMLFFSSGAVYGKEKVGDIIDENFCGDFDFLNPGSIYGESKRCGEVMCRAYFNEYGVPVKSLRIFHSYGPTMDLENDKRAFTEFTKNIVEGHDIILKSEGTQKRAFCYITDAINAIIAVLIRGVNGESYNLANVNQFVSIRELAQILVGLYPEQNLVIKNENRVDRGYLSLAQTNDIPCSTKKIEELGCKFNVSISDGFKRTIDYKKQKYKHFS